MTAQAKIDRLSVALAAKGGSEMSKQDRMEFLAYVQAQLVPLLGRLERAGIDRKPGWRTEIERLEAEAAALRRERDELVARLAAERERCAAIAWGPLYGNVQ